MVAFTIGAYKAPRDFIFFSPDKNDNNTENPAPGTDRRALTGARERKEAVSLEVCASIDAIERPGTEVAAGGEGAPSGCAGLAARTPALLVLGGDPLPVSVAAVRGTLGDRV